MENVRPYVAMACLCEKVLTERDGVLSAIRIVDKLTVKVPDSMPENVTPLVEIMCLVSLKSGAITGKSEVSLKFRKPSGEITALHDKHSILLNGEEHGVNLIVKLALGVTEYGLFWIDVYWNNYMLTSIALRLIRESPEESQPDSHSQ